MNTIQTIEQMRQSPYVREKELFNGISSFNFTREAFWDRHWTNATVKARGLFIDVVNKRLKARSYDKFFTIGERRETALDILAENFEYPVKAYIKYNGYLGICAGEKKEDGTYNIWCASKSTDQGWYAARFEDLLRDALKGYTLMGETRLNHFARHLYEGGLTAIFEVIDPIQDPHIIKYDKPQVILLDLIMNDDRDVDMWTKDYEIVEIYNTTWQLPHKKLAYNINNAEELYEWYEMVKDPAYDYNGQEIEGFVLEDLDCHMVKVKTVYYDLWKGFRPAIHKFYKGEKIDYWNFTDKLLKRIPSLEEEDLVNIWKFIYWLEKYMFNIDYEPSIIEVRDAWIKEQLGVL